MQRCIQGTGQRSKEGSTQCNVWSILRRCLQLARAMNNIKNSMGMLKAPGKGGEDGGPPAQAGASRRPAAAPQASARAQPPQAACLHRQAGSEHARRPADTRRRMQLALVVKRASFQARRQAHTSIGWQLLLERQTVSVHAKRQAGTNGSASRSYNIQQASKEYHCVAGAHMQARGTNGMEERGYSLAAKKAKKAMIRRRRAHAVEMYFPLLDCLVRFPRVSACMQHARTMQRGSNSTRASRLGCALVPWLNVSANRKHGHVHANT
eukprot:361363-Chlamydomonas_euryale.AAC.7